MFWMSSISGVPSVRAHNLNVDGYPESMGYACGTTLISLFERWYRYLSTDTDYRFKPLMYMHFNDLNHQHHEGV
jgi:hypothetical protein